MLVGYEDSLRAGCVRYSVWIFDWSDFGDRLQSLCIDNDDFVLSGCRCVYFAQFWNRPNAVDVGKAIEVRNNFAFLRVEDHQLISIHVGDVETAVRAVKTLVVEANRGIRKGHVRHLLQWCRVCVVGGDRGRCAAEYRNQYC